MDLTLSPQESIIKIKKKNLTKKPLLLLGLIVDLQLKRLFILINNIFILLYLFLICSFFFFFQYTIKYQFTWVMDPYFYFPKMEDNINFLNTNLFSQQVYDLGGKPIEFFYFLDQWLYNNLLLLFFFIEFVYSIHSIR